MINSLSFLIFGGLIFLFIIVLRALDQLVKYHGDGAQDDNGGDHHVELEDLRTIDNQIPEASSGGQKFSDDDAHKGKAGIDFHAA